jgi:alpha-beta hydrolase superfamily lysophospholipase
MIMLNLFGGLMTLHKQIRNGMVLLGILSLVGLLPASASALPKPTCENKNIEVTLSETDSTTYTLNGELCYRNSVENKTIQILSHGTASSAAYWDFPYQAQKHSYVLDQTSKGYVTFAINTFGSDPSDRPPAEQVTVQSNAQAVHQIVQVARDGSLSGEPHDKVVLAGHSSGSAVALYAAATYDDVDGVILTGLMHDGALPVEEFMNLLHPASSDPKFADMSGLDGYFTTKPGANAFYFNTDFAKLKAIAVDNELKGTVSVGDLNSFFIPLLPGFSNQLDVPVLLAVGSEDKAFCSATLACDNAADILARESSHFASEACLEAVVQPDAAHAINLHPNADVFFDASSDWIARRVGTAGNPATQPCQ